MSRKSKIDPVLKIKAVEDILVGKKGVCEVARELRVDESTVRGLEILFECNPESLRPANCFVRNQR